MSISIINAGVLSMIQDQGRYLGMDFGMSQSGAMDTFASKVANLLVGNEPVAPVVEIVGGIFKFQALKGGVFSLTGAMAQVFINQVEIKPWESYCLNAGDIVEIKNSTFGFRNYLAFSGEFTNLSYVMGSCATDLKAGVGGLGRGRLKAKDVLEVDYKIENFVKRFIEKDLNYFKQMNATEKKIRVMLGPQEDAFHKDAINVFFDGVYQIDHNSDRMGIRLTGPKITHLDKADILSDVIAFGAIQISGNGMPIVMMADRQTTGGYAKIGTVISADLPIMAQLKPGDYLRFVQTDFSEEACWHEEVILNEKRIKSSNQLSITVDSKTYNVLIEELIP